MSLTCKCEPFTQVAQLVFFFLDEEDFKHLNLFVREAKLSPYKENIWATNLTVWSKKN